ncbi:sulfatase-like hydrolase/transferase [Pusillimonas sp. CC-YST705]|uniref:Sulfatase-like hydrolase/transferase n=1 Tax=Mesopusillimonas faecipullorum TaxID=2755040 RepID=A0ABS8CCN6_9BURK|nr:sulfatase-like hydrolase/transferase [Mesopusillimonas faecipullorum]MCB5363783.1 sulfatase-like hydrolase/transferase [Mesopusillimonas faecipullorum]
MNKLPRSKLSFLLAAGASAVLLAACSSSNDSAPEPDPVPPTTQKSNILFVVIDDFGLDQLTSYGYGGAVPPKTPNLTAIAKAGLQFRQAWSMPTCTPTRATFFTGRYPSSTNILNAVVSTDLANSEISPYEVTLPKLLRSQGYTSALIGKMHLTGTDLGTAANLPYGHQTMWKLGWDYFDGYLDGAPYPIDTRAGLSNLAEGTHKCGFVSNTTMDPTNGADSGACYFVTNSCEPISRSAQIPTPGRSCMERGGIFDPGQSCQSSLPTHLDFTTQNGYYTGEFVQSWPDGRTRKVGATDPSARGYRSTMETDRAVAWAAQQDQDTPWMMSVGYSAVHAPLQVPPLALISETTPGRNDNLLCSPASDLEGVPGQITGLIDDHIITNLMVEAMDKEIGRLLVELKLATWNPDGTLNYQPEKTNTVVVVMGDNGTYVNSVKFTAPGQFDPTRAKGFPYQTGVSVPLLVAGPMVEQPGREVSHQVSSPDLYQLFAEIAGADLATQVPSNRPVDAQPMLAYLTTPGHGAIRTLNFTEMGTNFTNPSTTATPQPCVLEAANVCFTIFPNKALCDDQSGIWYGAGSGLAGVPADGFSQCGQVMSYRQALDADDQVDVLPDSQKAVSDGLYKLVRLDRKTYTTDTANPINASYLENVNTDELYQIDMAVPNPKLDRSGSAIAVGSPVITAPLPADAQQAYDKLKAEMDTRDQVARYNYLYDTVHCPGDGNRDGVVDQTDLANWTELSQLNLYEGVAQSSWYDFNHDGKTDATDRAIIEKNMGKTCSLSPT